MTLTPRQFEVARLAATNLPRAEIARRLGVSYRTIDATLFRVFRALNVETRRELAIALQSVTVRARHGGGQVSRLGLVRGDAVSVTGGRFAGRRGQYDGAENGLQVRVRIGGGTFALRAAYVQREPA